MSHNKPIKEYSLACLANEYIQDKNKKEIWLWHRRLGHLSFGYLKKLFPSLFHKCNIFDFICETCVMAKIHYDVFPLSKKKKKRQIPFSLIHTDVWALPHNLHIMEKHGLSVLLMIVLG